MHRHRIKYWHNICIWINGQVWSRGSEWSPPPELQWRNRSSIYSCPFFSTWLKGSSCFCQCYHPPHAAAKPHQTVNHTNKIVFLVNCRNICTNNTRCNSRRILLPFTYLAPAKMKMITILMCPPVRFHNVGFYVQ